MIVELEMTYADLKHENDNVTAGYQRLAGKHNAFTPQSRAAKDRA
jgi:hypothetical protein